ncbi:uncharacterized protein IUM83_04490 [Phytophthora cinnamomi]|uniref:uncharacterized protein n=1 Tax=Phytophthora cinnamomi TaxID=4785 RepID=UPI0035594651|nr:hypothetical protein IUM83_04490 [Phytophthora cinnamomi]
MVLSRVVVLLCVAAAVVLSDVPGAGVGAELVPRQLEQEAVKVHVKVHQNEAALQPQHDAPAKKHHSHHKKEQAEEAADNSETVRNYDHGTVRIESKDAQPAKKQAKGRHHKDANQQAPADEIVVEYNHGSVKISGKKASVTTGGDTERAKDKPKKAKKAAAPSEKEVTNTANDVNKLVTKLSSTDSADKKSFVDAYGPVVVICGIIGGLAAIIGVAGLVMGEPKSNDDTNLDSVLDNSADLDVEANTTSAGVQDAANDGSDPLDSSDAEEEEGTFANGAPHVSV